MNYYRKRIKNRKIPPATHITNVEVHGVSAYWSSGLFWQLNVGGGTGAGCWAGAGAEAGSEGGGCPTPADGGEGGVPGEPDPGKAVEGGVGPPPVPPLNFMNFIAQIQKKYLQNYDGALLSLQVCGYWQLMVFGSKTVFAEHLSAFAWPVKAPTFFTAILNFEKRTIAADVKRRGTGLFEVVPVTACGARKLILRRANTTS